MNKIKVLELFSGIRAFSHALENLGIDYECVDSVEIDKYAVKSQNAIYGTNFEPQDITKWDKDLDVDLIFHGSPCQDFSIAGKGNGGDEGSGTRSSLLYETIRIVDKLKPKYVIWENVKAVLNKNHKHNFDKYLEKMESLGYTNYYQVLNAKDYEIPQNRERVFTISILGSESYTFPPKQELNLRLKDMLENEVDEKYYLKEELIKKIEMKDISYCIDANYYKGTNVKQYEKKCRRQLVPSELKIKNATKKGYIEAIDGDGIDLAYPDSETRRGKVQQQKSNNITTSDNLGVVQYSEYSKKKIQENIKRINNETVGTITANAMQSFNHDNCQMTVQNYRIRKLTPLECFRLMGFSDEAFYKAQSVNSNSQLYKQAGNSIVVNVLEEIIKSLLKGE